MKYLIIILSIFLFSCSSDTVEISKDEYTKLKGVTNTYPKYVYFSKIMAAANNFEIYQGSDGHEYQLHTEATVASQWIHYIDCGLCKHRLDSINTMLLHKP